MPCAMQKTTIGKVNGKVKGVVFTPDPTYNLYTIIGCNFGDTQGQAHLNGPFAHGQVQLQIEFWTDTQIVAKVDPMISGEPDQDNVSLVVAPVSGPQVQASGFSFYAAREWVKLTTIPQSAVTLAAVNDNGGNSVQPAYIAPAKDYADASAQVYRQTNGGGMFGGGQDYYNFKNLARGFVTDSMWLKHSDLNASDWADISGVQVTLYIDSGFSAAWDGDTGIRVNFGEQHIHVHDNIGSWNEDYGASSYALLVAVVGPRGVDPWSK